ncbi:hypothetical protein [Natronospirillum operosum]|uniref:hypothetical protein n=1 Tax=Natronospirillum operosum TaxID=2759953 RepID=UPI0014367B4E|nr:hypothetical protein [Natronospirillum operosum]
MYILANKAPNAEGNGSAPSRFYAARDINGGVATRSIDAIRAPIGGFNASRNVDRVVATTGGINAVAESAAGYDATQHVNRVARI